MIYTTSLFRLVTSVKEVIERQDTKAEKVIKKLLPETLQDFDRIAEQEIKDLLENYRLYVKYNSTVTRGYVILSYDKVKNRLLELIKLNEGLKL